MCAHKKSNGGIHTGVKVETTHIAIFILHIGNIMTYTFSLLFLNTPLPQRPRRAVRATHKASLPPHAYTTLSDCTPLCRHITALPPLPPPSNLDALIANGLHTFSLTPPPPQSALPSYFRRLGATTRHLSLCLRVTLHPSRMAISRRAVRNVIDDALCSLNVERFHMVLLNWPARDARYLDAAFELGELVHVGKVRAVGVANFSTDRLQKMKQEGVNVVCNHVCASLVDRRAGRMRTDGEGVRLLGGGVLCGGLLHEAFIGVPEPGMDGVGRVANGVKMVRAWGGWGLFQELLFVLQVVADKYGVRMGSVAVRWVLEQPGLAGVVVGDCQDGVDAVWNSVAAFGFELDEEDKELLHRVVEKGNDLVNIFGECGSEFVDI